MLNHNPAPARLDLTVRLFSALTAGVFLRLFFARAFLSAAFVPLLLFLPGGFGILAVSVATGSFIFETAAGISSYPFFLAAFAAGCLILLFKRLPGRFVCPRGRVGRTAVFCLGGVAAVFLLLTFVRFTYWLEAAALAIGYGSASLVWSRANDISPGRVARQIVLFGGAFVVCALAAVLLCEPVAHIIYGRPPRIDIGHTRFHPTRVMTPTPGFDGEVTFAVGDNRQSTPVSISSQGLRDVEIGPKKEGELRIFMLGDSFTMGMTMLLEETIGKQLEALLRERLGRDDITVINGGVSGYGPRQERDLLLELGMPLEPDIVIFQALPANDIDDTLALVHKYPEAYNVHWRRRFHYLLLRPHWQMRAHRWFMEHSHLYRRLNGHSERNPVVTALNRLRLVQPLELFELAPSAPRSYLVEINLRDFYPVLQEGWEMMKDDMRGIRDDCRERGIDLFAYSVPIHQVVDDDLWLATTNGLDIYERHKDTHIMREFCENEHIPFINILPSIKKHPDISSLYYYPDGHFTPAGAALVAELIADKLCARYFKNRQ